MTWKKIIKQAELIPFPPGSGSAEEESWMFPYDINETFVQSPRNRRRMSTETEQPEIKIDHGSPIDPTKVAEYLVLHHGWGLSHFDKINFEDPDALALVHDLRYPDCSKLYKGQIVQN